MLAGLKKICLGSLANHKKKIKCEPCYMDDTVAVVMIVVSESMMGIAKLAIYKTRKAKLKGKNANVLLCFKGMVSARVKMEQAYLLSLDIVGDQWYTDEVLCFFS